jgi:uncharacterized protein YjbJ (UPF0337 family)
MKTEKSQGMKGRVTVTLTTEETMGEVVLSRGGKLGLASPAAPGCRPRKPFGRHIGASWRNSRRCGLVVTQVRRDHMNAEQFKGKWIQFKGEVKQKWGKLTDDDLMQVEGNYDKFIGRVQERYGDKKEEVVRWADDWYTRQGGAAGAKPGEAQTPR